MELDIDIGRDVYDEARLFNLANRRPELVRNVAEFEREWAAFCEDMEGVAKRFDERIAALHAKEDGPTEEYESLTAEIERATAANKARLAAFESRRAAIQAEMDACKEAEGELLQ